MMKWFTADALRASRRKAITSVHLVASPPDEQEDHGGQHGPFPREYRPGLFIVTNIALIAARNNLLILKSGEPPFRQLTEFAPA
jgi:hypothetical protein